MIPVWLEAGLWGLVAGGALVIGAAVGYAAHLGQRAIAAVMAFGSGVLVSALCFELMEEAFRHGGLVAAAVGFLGGAAVYSAASWAINRQGAKHRKRSGKRQPSEAEIEGSGLAIAVGALLDGIPESIAIGLTLLTGGMVSLVTVAAVFISNVPEGLSSAAGMRAAGRSRRFVFAVWGSIAAATGLAAVAGYSLFEHSSPEVRAATTAVAAGGILAMLVDTMIPEACEGTHDLSGLIAALGFLLAFACSMLGR